MSKDKQYILEFVRNLSVGDYANAENSLQRVIQEKIKDRIKKSMKDDGADKEPDNDSDDVKKTDKKSKRDAFFAKMKAKKNK